MLTPEKMRRAHVVAANKREKEKSKSPLGVVKAKIQKKYGEDAFTTFTGGAVSTIDCVETGFRHLDDLLTGEAEHGKTRPDTGRGVPRGRIIEIFGKESSGKTTLLLVIVKAFQQAGFKVAFVDAEHAIDPQWAEKIGVNVEEWLFSQPNSAEEGLGIVDELVRSKAVHLVVVDSVANLVPQQELDDDIGDAHVGLQARLMAQTMRKLTGVAHDNNVTVIFINQTRAKIGGFSRFGPPPETTTGGNALRFYASIRLELKIIKLLRKGVRNVGAMVKIRCVKNKVASPFRDAYMELSFGKGVVDVHPDDDSQAGTDDEKGEK